MGSYAHIHEFVHDDRNMGGRMLHGEANQNEEERLTAKEAYDLFKEVWDEVEPPYSYRTREEVEELEELYADDQDMLDMVLRSLKWNDDYVKGSKLGDCTSE